MTTCWRAILHLRYLHESWRRFSTSHEFRGNRDWGCPRPLTAPTTLANHTISRQRRPTRPHGELRQATHDDLELVRRWREQFHWDSELQGGRTPELVDPYGAGLEDKIPNHWIWEVDGQPVHMSAMQDTGLGLQRIGPVFTPEEHRGRGYAAWVVATLSQRALDAGDTPSLYTDQANPVSNKIYQRIGYYAVADEGEVESMST